MDGLVRLSNSNGSPKSAIPSADLPRLRDLRGEPSGETPRRPARRLKGRGNTGATFRRTTWLPMWPDPLPNCQGELGPGRPPGSPHSRATSVRRSLLSDVTAHHHRPDDCALLVSDRSKAVAPDPRLARILAAQAVFLVSGGFSPQRPRTAHISSGANCPSAIDTSRNSDIRPALWRTRTCS